MQAAGRRPHAAASAVAQSETAPPHKPRAQAGTPTNHKPGHPPIITIRDTHQSAQAGTPTNRRDANGRQPGTQADATRDTHVARRNPPVWDAHATPAGRSARA